jgi:DNA-binding GntR family transcriptional regulator
MDGAMIVVRMTDPDPSFLSVIPPSGSVTKTEAAYHSLRLAIEEGRFAPGAHLPVAALKEALNMSSTPIQQALRLLQAEGLVQHLPHRGVVVSEFSIPEIDEIYDLRLLLEPTAARRAAEHGSDGDIAEIRTRQDALRDAVASGDLPHMPALNAEWHRAVHRAAHSQLLSEFINRLWGAVPVPALWLMRRARLSAEEHEMVVVALEDRDGDEAAAQMRAHVESGAHAMRAHLRELKHQQEE